MGTGQLLAVPRLSLCSGTTIDLSLLSFLWVMDFSNAFARINRPILFPYGPALQPNADFLKAKLGDEVRLERFDEDGHALLVDDPVRFNRLVEQFRTKLPEQ